MRAFQASILFSAITLTACQSNSYEINGSIKGAANGDTLFLTKNLETGVPSDTIIVEDGKFNISGETDSTMLCMIYSSNRNEINAPFFLEPGTITIDLSEEPGASRVGGTHCNQKWQELNDSVMVIGKEINRIAEHIYGNNLPEEEQKKGMEQIDKLNKRFSKLIVKTAEQNTDNEFGYFLITYYPEELIDNATRERLIKELPAEMRQRTAIQKIKATIKAAANTAEGATITNFTQPSIDGKELSLMDEVQKNKVTIIDFWASWCGPCKQEMPSMIQLYEKYQSKGLGIVGVSLDSDKDAWLQATEKLGVKWPQMSDLKGWDNEVSTYFNITSIPHTVVVDKKGKILRRGLRGEALEQYVAELLK